MQLSTSVSQHLFVRTSVEFVLGNKLLLGELIKALVEAAVINRIGIALADVVVKRQLVGVG